MSVEHARAQLDLFRPYSPDRMLASDDLPSDDTRSVNTVRAALRAKGREGTTCPCCERWVKVYHESFRWTMGAICTALARQHRDDIKASLWGESPPFRETHLPTFLQRLPLTPKVKSVLCRSGGGTGYVYAWGLIRRVAGARDDGDWRTGIYALTTRGWDFANGHLRVPKNVFIYNRRVLGFEGPEINITEALEGRFDYSALMGG